MVTTARAVTALSMVSVVCLVVVVTPPPLPVKIFWVRTPGNPASVPTFFRQLGRPEPGLRARPEHPRLGVFAQPLTHALARVVLAARFIPETPGSFPERDDHGKNPCEGDKRDDDDQSPHSRHTATVTAVCLYGVGGRAVPLPPSFLDCFAHLVDVFQLCAGSASLCVSQEVLLRLRRRGVPVTYGPGALSVAYGSSGVQLPARPTKSRITLVA
jgi:hypothetical protein